MFHVSHFSGGQRYVDESVLPKFAGRRPESAVAKSGVVPDAGDVLDLRRRSGGDGEPSVVLAVKGTDGDSSGWISKIWNEISVYVCAIQAEPPRMLTNEQKDHVLCLAEPIIQYQLRSLSNEVVRSREVDLEMAQSAREALIKTLEERWDGVRSLDAIARPRLIGAMKDTMRNLSELSKQQQIVWQTYKQEEEHLAQMLQRTPTREEVIVATIGKLTGTTRFSNPDAIRSNLEEIFEILDIHSLATPLANTGNSAEAALTLGDMLASRGHQTESVALRFQQELARVAQSLVALRQERDPMSRDVTIFLLDMLKEVRLDPRGYLSPDLAQVFGGVTVSEIARSLEVPQTFLIELLEVDATQELIGEMYGISRSMVCKIVSKISNRLKRDLEKAGFSIA